MRDVKNIWIYPLILMGMVFTLATSCSKSSDSGPTAITDIDGNVYTSVTIGTQEWMVENLKTTKFRDGEPISNVIDSIAWIDTATVGYCNYMNSADSANKYGRLYNWKAVTSSHNIAPVGWHVPTNAEWATLIAYLGGENIAGGALKEAGKAHWIFNDASTTNSSGFTGLPGGFRGSNNKFLNIGYYGNFWTTSSINIYTASSVMLEADSKAISANQLKLNGFSVRCIKD
jgi:uncharacterized protein (TIGR02145 family)